MDDIIDRLQELSESIPVPLELPDEDILVEVEEAILIPMPRDLKNFLLEVSNVVYGSLEPVTAADPYSHTYLPEVAAQAWDAGLPRYLIPICAHGDDYYAIAQDGRVFMWQNGVLDEDNPWMTIWDWALEIWLDNNL